MTECTVFWHHRTVNCRFKGCEKVKIRARGLCRTHYNHERWAEEPLLKEKHKQRTKRFKKSTKGKLVKAAYYVRNREKVCARSARNARADGRRASIRAWQVKNADKCKEYTKKSRAANPGPSECAGIRRRNNLRLVDGALLPDALFAHLRKQPCACCGAPSRPFHGTVDHIIPVAWLEKDPSLSALLAQPWCYQPLCRSCNSKKAGTQVWCFVSTGDVGAEQAPGLTAPPPP